MLGEHLTSKASNGTKKLEVTADGDDLDTVFTGGFSKSLRYGACLELNKVWPVFMWRWHGVEVCTSFQLLTSAC